MVKKPNGGKVWDGNGWNSLIDETDAQQPWPPKSTSWKSKDTTLFIGVSSFRDRRCPKTLYNFYSKAKHPERVYIGLVQQNKDSEDPDCVKGYCDLMAADPKFASFAGKCPFESQIKVARVEAKHAAGPCYGRHMQSYMLREQEFCMQTDSHMDVIPEWDEAMLLMWGRVNNEYGILSTYVHVKESIKSRKDAEDRHKHVPHLCQVEFTRDKNPRYVQAKLAMNLHRPKLTTAWAAGFSLAKCHAWRAVPYDPQLKMVFDGEEFSTAARLWTRGYDFYTPDMSFIGHDYNKVKDGPSPGSWNANPIDPAVNKASHLRLRTLLGIEGANDPEVLAGIGKYGVGSVRSMEQYQNFVGVNLTTLEHTTTRCNSILWVPFPEPSWPPTENNLGGPYWSRQLREPLPPPPQRQRFAGADELSNGSAAAAAAYAAGAAAAAAAAVPKHNAPVSAAAAADMAAAAAARRWLPRRENSGGSKHMDVTLQLSIVLLVVALIGAAGSAYIAWLKRTRTSKEAE